MTEQTIKYLGYTFNGPFLITTTFNEVAGVYIITTSGGVVIDVGETDNLNNRIPSHERRACWTRNDGVNLYFHHERNKDQRLELEKTIRNKVPLACGIA